MAEKVYILGGDGFVDAMGLLLLLLGINASKWRCMTN